MEERKETSTSLHVCYNDEVPNQSASYLDLYLELDTEGTFVKNKEIISVF